LARFNGLTPVPRGWPCLEVKRNLDGTVLEYQCTGLLFAPGERAVIRCDIEEAEPVVGGRLVLPVGALSFGYFWVDRPYIVYHWLIEGETFAHYVNIGRVASLEESRVVWDDYAVDVLAWPDGTVEVVDEDEIPERTEESILGFNAEAKARVLAELDAIVESVERETRSFGVT
jgi:predicted RNA-binding protein associated with RNAse of E/G family